MCMLSLVCTSLPTVGLRDPFTACVELSSGSLLLEQDPELPQASSACCGLPRPPLPLEALLPRCAVAAFLPQPPLVPPAQGPVLVLPSVLAALLHMCLRLFQC